MNILKQSYKNKIKYWQFPLPRKDINSILEDNMMDES